MRMRTFAGMLTVAATLSACGTSTAEPVATRDDRPATEVADRQRDDDCTMLAGVGPRLFAVDNAFGPDCITVRSDAVLYVQNFGEYKHSFTISEVEFGTKPFLVDVILPGGDTEPRKVDLGRDLEVGNYEFFCSLHGGMDGVLEVIAPIGT